jgi:hypothetical protein
MIPQAHSILQYRPETKTMGDLRSSLQSRYLDPASSLGEILFGLIMTLTFTLGAGLMLQEEGREGARALLIATVGCNIAWGIIDGVLYVIGRLFERGRLTRLGQRIRETQDDAEARGLVAGELDELLETVTTGEDRRALYARIVQNIRSHKVLGYGRVTREDLMGAVVCFWLVFFASFPAAIPFFFIEDPWITLRVSNAVLISLLFAAGYSWAKYTMAKPWVAGVTFLLGGLGLVRPDQAQPAFRTSRLSCRRRRNRPRAPGARRARSGAVPSRRRSGTPGFCPDRNRRHRPSPGEAHVAPRWPTAAGTTRS